MPDGSLPPLMSEAAADEVGREIWIEKYRPRTLEDVVGHEAITERLQRYINQQDLPHLLFAGPAGTGKTTSAIAIAKEIYGDDWRSTRGSSPASRRRIFPWR